MAVSGPTAELTPVPYITLNNPYWMTSENYVTTASINNIPGVAFSGTINIHQESATFGSVFRGPSNAWGVILPNAPNPALQAPCGGQTWTPTYGFKMYIPPFSDWNQYELVMAYQLPGNLTGGQVWWYVNVDGSYGVCASSSFAHPTTANSPSGCVKLGAWNDFLITSTSVIAYQYIINPSPPPPYVCYLIYTGSITATMQVGLGPTITHHSGTVDSGNAAGATYGPISIGDLAYTAAGNLKCGKIYGNLYGSVPYPSFVGGYLPDGAGSSSDWTPVGETDNWEAVSQIPGSSSAYVETMGANNLDMYAVSCNSVAYATVSATQIVACMYEDSGDTHDIALVIGNGTDEYRKLASTGAIYIAPPPLPTLTASNAGWCVTTSPEYYVDSNGYFDNVVGLDIDVYFNNQGIDPITGDPWTPINISNLQIGVQVIT